MQCSGGLKTKITKKYIFGRGKAQSAYYRYDARGRHQNGARDRYLCRMKREEEQARSQAFENKTQRHFYITQTVSISLCARFRKQNTKAFLHNINSLYQSMRKTNMQLLQGKIWDKWISDHGGGGWVGDGVFTDWMRKSVKSKGRRGDDCKLWGGVHG